MTEKELDKWFSHLNTYDLTDIFPALYEDEYDDVRQLYENIKSNWKNMSKNKKEELHRLFSSIID